MQYANYFSCLTAYPGAYEVAGGVAGTGSQATQQRLGRALDTRPTITVASGQLCQVLLIKPLTLPALWQ